MIRVRRTSCLPKSPPFLSDIIFISRKHSLLFSILYNFPVMFSMKKKIEEEKTHTQKKIKFNELATPFPPHPVRSNPLTWKLLSHAYMSHVAEMFWLPVQQISRSKRNVTVKRFYCFIYLGCFPYIVMLQM